MNPHTWYMDDTLCRVKILKDGSGQVSYIIFFSTITTRVGIEFFDLEKGRHVNYH